VDWEAVQREQQRQTTASMAEGLQASRQIRRQRLEDALAAMQSQALTRTAEEVAERRAHMRHSRPWAAMTKSRPHLTWSGESSVPTTPS
jgi:hypothetical protein